MRIIRPQQLIVLKSAYQIGKNSHLGISVIAGCYLSRTDRFVSEPEIWHAWETAPLSCRILDAAEPKPYGEFLLAGHAGIGRPVSSLDVTVRVGKLERRWRVEGENVKGGLNVHPFIKTPLDHPQTWGGKGCKDNPLGRGHEDNRNPTVMSIGNDGSAVTRSPLAAPTPIPHAFSVRKTHLDKVASIIASKHYLESDFPGYPSAIDHRYFQMAAPAQWLNAPEWPDSTPFFLEGFKADEAIIEGAFPAVRARAFAWMHGRDKPEEISLQRKTLWLLPDSDLGLQIFTGSIPIDHLFDEQIEILLVGLDSTASPRSTDHFQQIQARRSDSENSPFEFLLDPDLMPETATLNVIQDIADHPSSLRYSKTPPPAEKANTFYAQVREAIDQHSQYRAAQSDDAPSQELFEQPIVSGKDLQWIRQQESPIEGVTFAQVLFEGEPVQNKQFKLCRFHQCDFSALSLIDASFDQCRFENCTMTDSHWRQVKLDHCTIIDTQMDRAELSYCQWHRTTLTSSQLTAVRMAHSQWSHCNTEQTSLDQAQTESSMFSDCFFTDCTLEGALHRDGQFKTCIFVNCQASHHRFEQCALEKSSLIQGVWRDSHFNACRLVGVTCGQQIDFSGSRFEQCWLEKTGWKNIDLQKSQWDQCAIQESHFAGARLDQARFARCDMPASHLKDASLAHSLWSASGLQQSLFYNADLRDAEFLNCNLISANLAMTHLNVNTRFTQCLTDDVRWQPRRPSSIFHNYDRTPV